VEENGMTVTDLARPPYEPPALEVLSELTRLAEGAGPGGTLIVMQSGIPFAPGGADEHSG
jgi:hypothetical protein